MTTRELYSPIGVSGFEHQQCWREDGFFYLRLAAPDSCLRCPQCGNREVIRRRTVGRIVHALPIGMTPPDAVAHYKELNEVERGFHALKDPIGMRPIWHHNDRRVRAHIFVAALTFLLDRMLERRLRDVGSVLSSRAAWSALDTVRHVSMRVNGKLRTGITPGGTHAREVLKAVGLTERHPPQPPEGDETTM